MADFSKTMTMKCLFRLGVSSLILALGACSAQPRERVPAYRGFSDPDQLHAYLWGSGGNARLISAHRGGPGPGLPENALETFARSLELAPCIIECDVRLSRDGVAVLMHDDTLDRTTDGKGPVTARDLSGLRGLRLRDPSGKLTSFRIPTLGETLEWARGRCVLTLDVKSSRVYSRVLEALARHRAWGYAVVITYSHTRAEWIHTRDPRAVISASAGSPASLTHLLSLKIPASRLVAFVGTREPDPEVYRMLRARGIPAILGTMNHLDRRARRRGDRIYRELFQQGAQILSTDHVRRVARCLDAMGHAARVSSKEK